VSKPRYPIYVPSRGRSHRPLTIRFLQRDRVPFRVVVEDAERDAYAAVAGEDNVLVLDKSGGGLIYARNWIKQHSIDEGHERHWQLDDNIGEVLRVYRGRRIPCDSGPAFACVEDFVDRYTNVAIAGLAYRFFLAGYKPPISRNVHVYSCTLVNNAIPHRWRLVYNDDTDLCLQVLADGWCTVLVHVFACDKKQTMLVRGGNTDDLYQGDGRLEMARQLERAWPGVVHVTRRFGRPQHVIKAAWRKFDTPLVLRDDVKLDELPATDEYGLEVVETREVKSERLRVVRDELASL
jgi:hypothetical protein